MTNTDQLRSSAFHEAGHAVAAFIHGIRLISVDIQPQRLPGGGTGLAGANFAGPPDQAILGQGEDAVMPYLVTFIAGWQAEKMVNTAAVMETNHPHSDGQMVRKYAVGAICTPVIERGQILFRAQEQDEKKGRIEDLIDAAQERTEEFVKRFGKAIAAVAEALLADKVLTATDVAAIVASAPPD